MRQDGFFGREARVLFYQEIQVIGMRMKTFGVKAHRALAAVMFLDQFIEFFYERVEDLFLLLALRVREQPIAFNDQFEDLDGDHDAFFGQFSFMFSENIFEKKR